MPRNKTGPVPVLKTEGGKGSDPAVCPITGFTSREKMLFLSSWKKLIKTSPKEFRVAGLTLVLWMFDNIPNMRKRFEHFANCEKDELVGSDIFLKHSKDVALSIDDMAQNIFKPEELGKAMREMVETHLDLTPPVGTRFFKPLQSKIHLYIASQFRIDPLDETPQVWKDFFAVIVKMFEEEQKKRGLANSEQQSGAPSDNDCCCSIS